MNKITPTLKVLTLAGLALLLAGCNSLSKSAKSSSMIVIESLAGTTVAGEEAAYLQSDVVGSDGLVRIDNATAKIVARLINPDSSSGPSQFNDVVLTSYDVTYELPSGPGTPGVDVPLPFSGNFSTVLCQIDDEVTVPFAVVLEAAKQAAPLVNLVGTATVLETRAKIEIFGHDLTDHDVSATGYLTIYFADYQDTVGAAVKTIKK
jgi:hypothetical protein